MAIQVNSRLVLFFTDGVSLHTWDQKGMLEREVALYNALLPHLNGIAFVTHGDGRDLNYQARVPGIRIFCNRWNLPPQWYRRSLLPALWFWSQGCCVFKSNQVKGGQLALDLARRLGKPFIARCGYLPSNFMGLQYGEASVQALQAQALEREVFAGATQMVVTTQAMQETLVGSYGVERQRVRVVPNYVDTDLFAPQPDRRPPLDRILFVGRLDHQKNLLAFLDGLVGLTGELWLVGEGPQRVLVEERARQATLTVRFLGNQPHGLLPSILNEATLFVLPSLWEGHPKTLLEAMACGLPVLGSDVSGIREVIQHGENGWLCPPTQEGIGAAVRHLLAQPQLRARLGRQARQFILDRVSLARVVEMELDLLRQLVTD
ncbi:MAG: glycosyltransferase family 4 protein [Magnetococcus sp. DMHC-6]